MCSRTGVSTNISKYKAVDPASTNTPAYFFTNRAMLPAIIPPATTQRNNHITTSLSGICARCVVPSRTSNNTRPLSIANIALTTQLALLGGGGCEPGGGPYCGNCGCPIGDGSRRIVCHSRQLYRSPSLPDTP